MALDPAIGIPRILLSNELLNGDALVGDPTVPALHADDVASVLSQTAALPDPVATPPADSAAPPAGVTDVANAAVLDLHSNIEGEADSNGLVGSLHGVTGLGETIGLGRIGQANALTDILSAPTALLSGDSSTMGHLAPDAASIGGAGEALVSGTLSDVGADPSLLSPVYGAGPAAEALQPSALETFANAPILAIHATLESAADMDGTSGTIHGVTNLGETIGLGKIGGDNLLTDVAASPTSLMNGDLSRIEHLPADLSAIGTAATGVANGIEADIASGAVLQNPAGDVTAIAQSASAFPAASLANGLVDTVHGYAEGATDGLSPGSIHAVTGLGNTIGLGEIGGNNALTDVLAIPTTVGSGDTTAIAHLPSDAAAIGQSAGAVLGGVGSDLSGPALDAVTHPMTGAGLLAGDLPGHGIVDSVAAPVSSALGEAGFSLGSAPVTGAATDLASSLGQTGGDVLHVPAEVVAGVSQGLAPIPSDVGSNLASIGTVVGSVAGEIAHLPDAAGDAGMLSPLSDVLGGSALSGDAGTLAHGDLASSLAPVADIIGSETGPLSSATSLLGNNGVGAGNHDLATIAIGPQGDANAGTVDLLGSSGGPSHVVDVHAASVPASVPTVANVGLLTGESFSFPSAGGHGADALTGALSATGASAAAPAAPSVEHSGMDLGLAHVDLPAGTHGDPLAELGHVVHHA